MASNNSSKGSGFFYGSLAQTAADTSTWAQIPTGVNPGDAVALAMESMTVYWDNARTAGNPNAVTDFYLGIMVGRSPVIPSLVNPDVFGMASVSVSKAGVAQPAAEGVSMIVMPDMFDLELEPSLTLQPYIYVGIVSGSTAQANSISFRISYNSVKLTQNEYVKLLAAAA